jgi:hypothetical protein
MKKSFYEEKRRNKCFKNKLDDTYLSFLPKFSLKDNSENLFKFESLKLFDDHDESKKPCGKKLNGLMVLQNSKLSELFSHLAKNSSDSQVNKYRRFLLEIIL